jgi:hypothetical protein
MRGKTKLLIVFVVFCARTSFFAEGNNLVIHRFNHFLTNINFHPGQSTRNLIVLNYVIGGDIIATDGTPLSDIDDIEGSNVAPSLTLPALFYPNPFRLEDGADLGYRLSRGDMDISIRMYDMRGNQIFRKDIAAGEPGAVFGYNHVPFNRSVLGHSNLPSGVYFYIIMNDGKVLGKGKVAVKP